MLRWTITFLIIAIVAAIFGFGGIAGTAAWIAPGASTNPLPIKNRANMRRTTYSRLSHWQLIAK